MLELPFCPVCPGRADTSLSFFVGISKVHITEHWQKQRNIFEFSTAQYWEAKPLVIRSKWERSWDFVSVVSPAGCNYFLSNITSKLRMSGMWDLCEGRELICHPAVWWVSVDQEEMKCWSGLDNKANHCLECVKIPPSLYCAGRLLWQTWYVLF